MRRPRTIEDLVTRSQKRAPKDRLTTDWAIEKPFKPTHAAIDGRIEAVVSVEIELRRLFERVAERLNPDYGMDDTMSLKDQILRANIAELAGIAVRLMLGNGPQFNGMPVIFSYDDAKLLILKLRPEIDYAEVDSIIKDSLRLDHKDKAVLARPNEKGGL